MMAASSKVKVCPLKLCDLILPLLQVTSIQRQDRQGSAANVLLSILFSVLVCKLVSGCLYCKHKIILNHTPSWCSGAMQLANQIVLGERSCKNKNHGSIWNSQGLPGQVVWFNIIPSLGHKHPESVGAVEVSLAILLSKSLHLCLGACTLKRREFQITHPVGAWVVLRM